MKVITATNEVIDNFAIFMEIEDETLRKIEENPKIIKGMDFMIKAVQENGRNCHIVQLTLNNSVNIFNCIDGLLKRYNTVSWCDNEENFSIRRRK